MFIEIDFETEKPIYRQLIEQIIAGIAMKKLLPGERLPSVRNMAEDIGINMHTVNKAYQELRDREFILIHRQRGVVVNPAGPPEVDEEYLSLLKEELEPLLAEAIARNLSKEKFEELIKEILRKYENKEGE